MKLLRNNRGVAMIIVLGAVVMLTTLVVEFAFNSHITYSIASHQRDRLRAYFLARSALQFAKLELHLEKQIRRRFGSKLQQFGISSQPICQQIPFDTRLFRGFLEMSSDQEGEKPSAEASNDGNSKQNQSFTSMIEKEKVQSFLDFTGDFALRCSDEQSKININYFRDVGNTAEQTNPSANLYELHKEFLTSFFMSKDFESIFKEDRSRIDEVVRNIADWVDRNDRINQSPGIEGGMEQNNYVGPEYTYRVKNGKMSSLAELLLVSGVGDDLFQLASPHLSVYGDNKVNACASSEPILEALIRRYALSLSPPIQIEDEEKMKELVLEIQMACEIGNSSPKKIVSALHQALGVPGGRGANQAQREMEKQLSSESRFYSLDLTGVSGDVELLLKAVLDTQGDASQWKLLYYRVQ